MALGDFSDVWEKQCLHDPSQKRVIGFLSNGERTLGAFLCRACPHAPAAQRVWIADRPIRNVAEAAAICEKQGIKYVNPRVMDR